MPAIRRPPDGTPYDPSDYVPRGIEAPIADHLFNRNAVVVWGPRSFGKTWCVRHLIAQIEASERWKTLFVPVMFRDPEPYRRLRSDIARAGRIPDGDLEAIEGSPASETKKLSSVVERLLRGTRTTVLLVLDFDGTLLGSAERDELFGCLRAWVEKREYQPWNRLRLLITSPAPPALLVRDVFRSIFNVAEGIELPSLSMAGAAQLAGQYGMGGSRHQTHLEALTNEVGGHPRLLRQVLYRLASHSPPDGPGDPDGVEPGMIMSLKPLRLQLAPVIPSPEEIEMVARDAGLACERVTFSHPPEIIWQRVLELAERSGRLLHLLGEAKSRFPEGALKHLTLPPPSRCHASEDPFSAALRDLDTEQGLLGGHLRRLWDWLEAEGLVEDVWHITRHPGAGVHTIRFLPLFTAGLLVMVEGRICFRCEVYQRYIERRLAHGRTR